MIKTDTANVQRNIVENLIKLKVIICSSGKAVSSPVIQAEKVKVRSPQSLVALFLAGFAEWRHADKIGHLGGCRQTAIPRIAAVPLFAVECCPVPSLAADVTIRVPGARDNREPINRAGWANRSLAQCHPSPPLLKFSPRTVVVH
jgi:hypothetical protein